mmetsp:Transcript_6420/g.17953  ORF Transcript_6420/g.17953 Transcript_6420/m.17953 type:complete len:201 (+) Transcript_6420:137-739(+)
MTSSRMLLLSGRTILLSGAFCPSSSSCSSSPESDPGSMKWVVRDIRGARTGDDKEGRGLSRLMLRLEAPSGPLDIPLMLDWTPARRLNASKSTCMSASSMPRSARSSPLGTGSIPTSSQTLAISSMERYPEWSLSMNSKASFRRLLVSMSCSFSVAAMNSSMLIRPSCERSTASSSCASSWSPNDKLLRLSPFFSSSNVM